MAWQLLDAHEKRLAVMALAVAVLSALFSGAMVASIMPFLTVMADPSRIVTDAWLSWLYGALGFTSSYHFLVALGLASLCVILLATFIQLLRVYVLSHFALMRMHSLSCKLLENYLRQPYAFFRDRHTGEMGTQILNETQQVVMQFFRPASNIIAALFSIVVLVCVLFWVNPIVTLACFAVFVGIYGLTYYFSQLKLKRLGGSRVENNKLRFKIANEALGGIKDIILVSAERSYLKRFEAPSYDMAKAQVSATVVGEMPSYVLQGVALGGVILLSLLLLDSSTIEDGSALADMLPLLGVFAFAGLRMIPELQRFYLGVTQAQFAAAAVQAIHEDLCVLKGGKVLLEHPPEPLTLKQGVALEGVCYRFPSAEHAVLNDITVRIQAGTKVGVVGTTGAGKTTFADLLLGLNTPHSGTLKIDGVAIDEANIRAWQRSIGYVPQDIFLVDASIAENIALGEVTDSIDHARVKEACRIASLARFVQEELADGYNTFVGERGVKLSGGQRQRVGIARALYHNASFFVFDEATSALDNETEQEVMTAINALPGDKTILMIAHRLNTVRACDSIIVLDKGRIVGHGPWDELVATNEVFKRLTQNEHGETNDIH
jgi:ABC-type multidrug transport system fused ATPase/permease subunit